MFTIVGVIVALIGAFVQSRRHRHRPAADIHMLWWMVLIVGVVSIIGAGYHVFDGERTAELIGYTRGDGGFQWENAMGDLAIGVVGLMAYRFRGHFWLATIVVLTIQYVGDAAGHIYYWVVENNTNPYNIGVRCGPTSCYPSSCGRSMRGRGTATATRCRKVSLSHRARRRSPLDAGPRTVRQHDESVEFGARQTICALAFLGRRAGVGCHPQQALRSCQPLLFLAGKAGSASAHRLGLRGVERGHIVPNRIEIVARGVRVVEKIFRPQRLVKVGL